MTYTVQQLISDAFYKSKVFVRNFDAPSASDINVGLQLLNELLSRKSIHSRMIPFYTEYEFNAVVGQEEYSVPRLVEADTLTFNLGTVRYSSDATGRNKYFGADRVDDITTLPYTWTAQRALNGTNIYLFPLPADTFPIKVWGKFEFTPVVLADDLELVMEFNYIQFMKFELTKQICIEYGASFPETAEKELQIIKKEVLNISPLDLNLKQRTQFGGKSLNWAIVNLSGGWVP